MAWTAPMTAVTGNSFTAAQFNTYIRDNLLETAPSKVTASGQIIVSNGANSIQARTPTPAWATGSSTRASTSYGDLAAGAGPAATVTTGDRAMVAWSGKISHSVADSGGAISVAVSGATTIAVDDEWSVQLTSSAANRVQQASMFKMFTGLTPGSNTFTLKYKSLTTASTSTFSDRHIVVIPL